MMESMATSFIVRENLFGGIPLVRLTVIKITTAGIPNTEKGTTRQDEEIPNPGKNGRQRSPNQAVTDAVLAFSKDRMGQINDRFFDSAAYIQDIAGTTSFCVFPVALIVAPKMPKIQRLRNHAEYKKQKVRVSTSFHGLLQNFTDF